MTAVIRTAGSVCVGTAFRERSVTDVLQATSTIPCANCAGAALWALYLKAVMRGGAAIVSQSTMVLDVSSAWWDITPTPTVKFVRVIIGGH